MVDYKTQLAYETKEELLNFIFAIHGQVNLKNSNIKLLITRIQKLYKQTKKNYNVIIKYCTVQTFNAKINLPSE